MVSASPTCLKGGLLATSSTHRDEAPFRAALCATQRYPPENKAKNNFPSFFSIAHRPKFQEENRISPLGRSYSDGNENKFSILLNEPIR